MSKDRIIMFGASIGGKQFLSYVKENDKYEILAVADNDKSKQNTLFCDIPVIDPIRISDYEYDYIIITSMYTLEIKEQLLNEFKIDPLKIKETPKSITDPKKTYRAFEDKKTLERIDPLILDKNSRIPSFS
ncbi:MAG TPA: hypothetical protein GXX63_09065 [Tissierellia bacterium]|nr:hypothetical protein [Tissierellia bacterium]